MTSIGAIAAALGGDVAGLNTILCPGPNHSPRDRSLAVKLDPRAPDGFVTYSHAGDDWRDCRDHVRQRLSLPPWQAGDGRQRVIPQQHVAKWDLAIIEAEAADIPRPFTDEELARIDNARRLWDEAQDPRGTLAERYLRETRKLDLPDELANKVLRFHPACPWGSEDTGKTDHVPALIVPLRSIDDDALTAVHRIALNDDGSKAGRRMLGVVHRTAIKLDAKADTLAIGEGVETCMAARELGYAPVWALGSVGAISFFPPIAGTKQLVILGERGEASRQAIEMCGRRWRKAGRKIRVIMPNEGLGDLNDVLIAERTAS
jgi:putative DNA primase/helicase